MACHVYVDTNIFLDFYELAREPVAVFDELLRYPASIIIPEQTINEFLRNRDTRLKTTIRKFEDSVRVLPFTTALTKHLTGFDELIASRDKFDEHAKRLTKRLKNILKGIESDPVVERFARLRAEAIFVGTRPEYVAKAQVRKTLGQPPNSPKKDTIGDELNWECLIAHATACATPPELVIVTRDEGYHDHAGLLTSEYNGRTHGRLRLITASLAAGLTTAGLQSAKIAEQEEVVEREVAARETDGKTCPFCGRKDALGIVGFESETGEAAWIECKACGKFVDGIA